MPYTNSNGVRIYYEIEGQGPAVLFAHGGTSTLQSWKERPSIDRLADAYTLIFYDARGHGQSDRPTVPQAYAMHFMASDALSVLDAIGVEQTHFWGYSMGGWTGFQLAKEAPHRLRSLILGGTSPASHPKPLDAPPDPLLRLMREGVEHGTNAVLQGMREMFGEISPQYEGRLRNLDYRAMVALLEQATYHSTDQRAILPAINVPCLVYMAEADDPGFVETQAWSSTIPDVTFVAIGGTHISGDPEAEVSSVRGFLDRVEAGR